MGGNRKAINMFCTNHKEGLTWVDTELSHEAKGAHGE